MSRQPPGFLSQSFDDRDYDDPDQEDAADQAYALEDYEEEPPAGRRRSGLIVVAAVLGLAVLGTAGAFAYRAMFGSSMLPSLPPIIKAEDGPNKIVPNKPKSNASDQADAGATSGEKLVSREEQPVDVPAPPSTAPRVVSTVPIFPDPNSGQAGVPSSAQGAALGSQPAAMAPSPVQTDTAPASPAPSIWPPASSTAAAATSGTASAAGAPAPRKIHTVIIRTDQMGAATADASAAAPPAPAALAPPPLRTAPARAAVQQARPAPAAPRVEGNGPLSITPDQNGPRQPRRAPAPRSRALSSTRRSAPSRRQPRAAMPFRSRRNAARRGLRRSSARSGPSTPTSLVIMSRSSGEPTSAPRASITGRSSRLPRWIRRPACAQVSRRPAAAALCNGIKAGISGS